MVACHSDGSLDINSGTGATATIGGNGTSQMTFAGDGSKITCSVPTAVPKIILTTQSAAGSATVGSYSVTSGAAIYNSTPVATAGYALTFTNVVNGDGWEYYFIQNGTTAGQITMTASGFTFYKMGTTASGNIVTTAMAPTIGAYYRIVFRAITATSIFWNLVTG